MSNLGVAEAADRLGVNVWRVHQRIADGSLRAERIGSQWVIDERSLLEVAERRAAGRPLSARSAWAVIAASEDDDEALKELAPAERSRAKARLIRLLSGAEERLSHEADARALAVSLRLMFRNRAERRLFRVAAADLDDLRADEGWALLVASSVSGIASRDVEGYVAESSVEKLVNDFLLVSAVDEANVVAHVLPENQKPYSDSKLRLAADLAEHRGPREEARAAELLHELARERRKAQR
jgi:excisionase family DNA binding protein